MKPQRARYARIKSLATTLLHRFDVHGPSVPIVRLLAESGLTVRFGDLGDVSGFLARTGGTATVGINGGHSQMRQRFTMAHEFGHFLLHQDLGLAFRHELPSSLPGQDFIGGNRCRGDRGQFLRSFPSDAAGVP